MANFGIGSRNMFDAGRMVLRKRSRNGFKTQDDYIDRWRLFCEYAKDNGVTKMEKVSREFVIGYGQHLQRQLEAGVYRSASAPKNYLSAVNCVMRLATGGQWQTVKPGADCGIQKRSYIPKATKALSDRKHVQAQQDVSERIAHLLALQRTFGLRFKESCLLNPKTALKQAEKSGTITVKAGTKGGRPRRVPCTEAGKAVLAQASQIQHGKSMVPVGDDYISYYQFRQACYAQAVVANLCFHAERHAYAQNRYRELVKAPCPLEAGWEHKGRIAKLAEYLAMPAAEAKELDRSARLQISMELGHSRVEISHAYLG
ncbi:integrase domain-containing protein [Methylobacter luteus]|jgi:hypothetical protein|uniref:integrase domain-containing protein n=1 Tax=Methylobacter luteus TaxID=415 RepID=UPI000418064B|nr:integrase domain-containing protein [Methylobacter luteus]